MATLSGAFIERQQTFTSCISNLKWLLRRNTTQTSHPTHMPGSEKVCKHGRRFCRTVTPIALKDPSGSTRECSKVYLHRLLISFRMTLCVELSRFLELSAASLYPDIGWKGKEGRVEIARCSRSQSPPGCRVGRGWRKFWMACRDSHLAFCATVIARH